MSRTVTVYRPDGTPEVFRDVLFDRAFGSTLLMEHVDGRRIYLAAGEFARVESVPDRDGQPRLVPAITLEPGYPTPADIARAARGTR